MYIPSSKLFNPLCQLQKIRLSRRRWPLAWDLVHTCPTSPSSTNIYWTPWLLFVPIQQSTDQKKFFFTGYDRDHFSQNFLSQFEHVDGASQKRSLRPICGIARLSCTLASTKVWSSEPAACLRSSIAKMTSAEILENRDSRLIFDKISSFFSNATLLGQNKGNTFWGLANAL